jgi:hypothetical protein
VTPPPASTAMTVKIDILSGEFFWDFRHPVVVNPRSHGKLRVAVFSNKAFNAPAMVKMNSLTFGHSGSEPSLAFCDTHRFYLNFDRIPDLVCYFNIDKMNFQKGDTVGILKGMLVDGVTQIYGTDSIRIAH